jgi:hypothetical protein
VYIWGILAGSSIGLLASTLGRLYVSTYYALRRCANAVELRAGARRAHHRTRLPVRAAAASPAGARTHLGRCRSDDVGRHRRAGRDDAAPDADERAHRTDQPAVGYTLRLWVAA